MGVAGSGKSTVARAVAAATGLALIEGDDFHTPQNISKMSAGIALTDADRGAWLDLIAQQLVAHPAGAVVSCSALKRAYRDKLRAASPGLRFAFLAIPQPLALERVLARSATHFFPPSSVASQFAALEDPGSEPGVLTLDAALPTPALTARILAWMAGTAPD